LLKSVAVFVVVVLPVAAVYVTSEASMPSYISLFLGLFFSIFYFIVVVARIVESN
jgi:hypothetical protein